MQSGQRRSSVRLDPDRGVQDAVTCPDPAPISHATMKLEPDGGRLASQALRVLSPALRADFVLIDDHAILAHAAATLQHPQAFHPSSVVERAFAEDSSRGRFRPVSVLINYAQIDVLQDRPWAWHAFTIG